VYTAVLTDTTSSYTSVEKAMGIVGASFDAVSQQSQVTILTGVDPHVDGAYWYRSNGDLGVFLYEITNLSAYTADAVLYKQVLYKDVGYRDAVTGVHPREAGFERSRRHPHAHVRSGELSLQQFRHGGDAAFPRYRQGTSFSTETDCRRCLIDNGFNRIESMDYFHDLDAQYAQLTPRRSTCP
jgi:hypothetical protein